MTRPSFTSEQVFNVHQAVVIAEVTPRQLQWWREKKFLKPIRQGHALYYTLHDLMLVVLITKLARMVTSERLRDAFAQARKLKEPYLVCEKKVGPDGRPRAFSVRWAKTHEEVIALGLKAKCGVQLIDVQELREEIEARRAHA